MNIGIQAIGGYNEVGKNMTAVKVGDEVILLDMGIHLDNYVKYQEAEEQKVAKELILAGAVPNVDLLENWQEKVKAVIATHAHLDHVGAIPFLAQRYKAPVIGTPFTTSVVNTMLADEKIKLENQVKTLNQNSFVKLSPTITAEFIGVTHSTPQTVMVALHTPAGVILYCNDFKFDLYPTLGPKPNFERLQELGKSGVAALVVESTYAAAQKKMPSESVAKEMLKDVLLGTESKGRAVIVSTFSSHLARLKSIIEMGNKLNRKIVFLGRSLAKYSYSGQECGIIKFDDVEIMKYSKQVKRFLKKITPKTRSKYLFVVTGHQGEPGSTLTRMVDRQLDFKFEPEDHMVFSCTVIPTAVNVHNREYVEKVLKEEGVRIFRDIHVSGHAAREDLRDLINMVKPKNIIPAHGNIQMTSALADLASEMGFSADKIHLLRNGQRINL